MQYFNLYGPLNELGYGVFVRGLIKGLYENGMPNFFLSPMGGIEVEDQNERNFYTNQANKYLWRRDHPAVAVWHEFDLAKFSSKKLVAFPIFETTKFNQLSKNYLTQMDAIFVMSSWGKQVVEEDIGNNIPVFVVPGSANLVKSPEVDKVQKNSSAFTFLSIGKYEQRKSPLEVLKAYLMAFESSKFDTRLILHCYNPFDRDFSRNISTVLAGCGLSIVPSTSISTIVATKGSCIVEIPSGRIPALQVSQLYKYAHIGVFPAKAEGWNLPLMEAIQSGLPCIATNYSAHTDYLNDNFNYNKDLLISNLVRVSANDGVWFHGDRGDWMAFPIESLAEKMYNSYKNYDSIISTFDNSKIVETFTWKNSARQFLGALDSV